MRRNLTLALTLAAGLLGGFLSRYISPSPVHAQAPPSDPVEIRAQRFSVVDARGQTIGTFAVSHKKSPAGMDAVRISLIDPAGNELWSAGGDPFKALAEGSK